MCGDCGAFLLHCNGLAEERKEIVRLMNEIWRDGKSWKAKTRW